MTDSPNDRQIPSWFQDITKDIKLRPQSCWPVAGSSVKISEDCKKNEKARRIKSSVSDTFLVLDDVPNRVSLITPRYGRRATPHNILPNDETDSSENRVLSLLEARFGELTSDYDYHHIVSPCSGSRSLSPSNWKNSPFEFTPFDPNPSHRLDNVEVKENKTSIIDKNLEESWTSLNLFNRIQRGRLLETRDGSGIQDLLESSLNQFCEEETFLPTAVTPETEVNEIEEPENFIIPELPKGEILIIDVKTTWGDRHYLGLNGIEIFSDSGELVQVSKIEADPADINVLPEYSKDPRVVANLLDRVNRTRDDMHLWLTPFTPGNHHTITITFPSVQTLSLIRIWNYNKSRIHSCRGAKDVVITLDDNKIFQGEIARASGGILGSTDSFGDTILFTTDEVILELVSKNDDSFESVMNEAVDPSLPSGIHQERPLTADTASPEVRPYTSYSGSFEGHCGSAVLCESNVTLELTATWSSSSTIIGLTGLQVVSDKEKYVAPSEILCSLHQNNVERLLNGINETTDSDNMWKTQFDGDSIKLVLIFKSPVHISAICLWNYNENMEMTFCGVKMLSIYVDDKLMVEDAVVRKAPGHCQYLFCQRIPLVKSTQSTSSHTKTGLSFTGLDTTDEYEVAETPCGFVYQFTLLSTWGDTYYIGLNGIELYGSQARRIDIEKTAISAYPSSINILEGVENDVRTAEKLVDGVNNKRDGRHAWLAPVLPSQINRLYIVFDKPTYISMVKIWNYGKTPSRGVKEFGILVDDLLIYNGVLECADKISIPNKTIIFSGDYKMDQSFTNNEQGNEIENMIETRRFSVQSADQSLRPFTSLQLPLAPSSRSQSLIDF